MLTEKLTEFEREQRDQANLAAQQAEQIAADIVEREQQQQQQKRKTPTPEPIVQSSSSSSSSSSSVSAQSTPRSLAVHEPEQPKQLRKCVLFWLGNVFLNICAWDLLFRKKREHVDKFLSPW